MKLIKFFKNGCSMCMMQTKELENHPLTNDIKIQAINLSTDPEAHKYIEEYKIQALPTIVLEDDDDNIVKIFRGFNRSADIDNFINNL